MPKMNDVASGEVIDSVWGNDIRDRSLQRVATYTDRDSSYLSPNPGDLVFIESADIIQVWDGANWLTLADLTDPVFTGNVTAQAFITAAGADGTFHEDGSIRAISVQMRDATPNLKILADSSPYFFRMVQGADGRVSLQTSGNDTDWKTVGRWSTDEFRTYETFIANGDVATTSDVGFQQGAAVTGYDPSPPTGGDLYGLQTRNIIIAEDIPASSFGQDGDVCMQYTFAGSAQNTPCNVWVKVQGAWRGMS